MQFLFLSSFSYNLLNRLPHNPVFNNPIENTVEQNVFVKHKCPCNDHFLKIVTLIFDLDK